MKRSKLRASLALAAIEFDSQPLRELLNKILRHTLTDRDTTMTENGTSAMAGRLGPQAQPVAWYEREGDTFFVYWRDGPNADTYWHITKHQKESHGVLVWPLYGAPAQTQPATRKPLADNELPPLPEYGIMEWVGDSEKGESVYGFTEEQMRDYARAALVAYGITEQPDE